VTISKGTFVAYTGGDGGATTVDSSSFDSTGVNLLIAAAGWEDTNSSGLTFTDNKGNTWQTALVAEGVSAKCAMAWCVPSVVGAGHVVTCNYGASVPFRRIAVLPVLGTFNAGDALDASASASVTTSANCDAGSLTTTAAAILVHAAIDYGGETFTQGAGWTKDSATTGRHMQSRIEAAGGTFDPAGTIGAAQHNGNVAFAFKEGAAPALGSFTIQRVTLRPRAFAPGIAR